MRQQGQQSSSGQQQQEGNQEQRQQGRQQRRENQTPDMVDQQRQQQDQQDQQQQNPPGGRDTPPEDGPEQPTEGVNRTDGVDLNRTTGDGAAANEAGDWGNLQPYLNFLKNRGAEPKVPEKYRRYFEAYIKSGARKK